MPAHHSLQTDKSVLIPRISIHHKEEKTQHFIFLWSSLSYKLKCFHSGLWRYAPLRGKKGKLIPLFWAFGSSPVRVVPTYKIRKHKKFCSSQLWCRTKQPGNPRDLNNKMYVSLINFFFINSSSLLWLMVSTLLHSLLIWRPRVNKLFLFMACHSVAQRKSSRDGWNTQWFLKLLMGSGTYPVFSLFLAKMRSRPSPKSTRVWMSSVPRETLPLSW